MGVTGEKWRRQQGWDLAEGCRGHSASTMVPACRSCPRFLACCPSYYPITLTSVATLVPVTLLPLSFTYCKDSGDSLGPTQITSPSPDPLLNHICKAPLTMGGNIPRLQRWKHRPFWGAIILPATRDTHKLHPGALCKNMHRCVRTLLSLLCGGTGRVSRQDIPRTRSHEHFT